MSAHHRAAQAHQGRKGDVERKQARPQAIERGRDRDRGRGMARRERPEIRLGAPPVEPEGLVGEKQLWPRAPEHEFEQVGDQSGDGDRREHEKRHYRSHSEPCRPTPLAETAREPQCTRENGRADEVIGGDAQPSDDSESLHQLRARVVEIERDGPVDIGDARGNPDQAQKRIQGPSGTGSAESLHRAPPKHSGEIAFQQCPTQELGEAAHDEARKHDIRKKMRALRHAR